MDVAPIERRQDDPPALVPRVPRETPRPDRVNRELERLRSHNKPGSSEAESTGRRKRNAPSRFSGNVAFTNEEENKEGFEYHFNHFVPPSWNDDLNCFETTPDSERDNPFANGFHLDPSHPSFVPFDGNQQSELTDVSLGYYAVPSAYLGYKLDEAPSILLHQIDMPAELLFEKKSLNDPDP